MLTCVSRLGSAPPGTSDEHLAIVQYLKEAKVDGAVIVTTPQEVALLDVRKEISFCNKVGVKVLGVVENMAGFVCPCCKVCLSSFSFFPSVVLVDMMLIFVSDKDGHFRSWNWRCCQNGRRDESAFLGWHSPRP